MAASKKNTEDDLGKKPSGNYTEDELGKKWDRCLTDGVIKLGGGLTIGAVVSLLFFRRRAWPMLIGAGFGIGMAYSNCERDINSAVIVECEPPKLFSTAGCIVGILYGLLDVENFVVWVGMLLYASTEMKKFQNCTSVGGALLSDAASGNC